MSLEITTICFATCGILSCSDSCQAPQEKGEQWRSTGVILLLVTPLNSFKAQALTLCGRAMGIDKLLVHAGFLAGELIAQCLTMLLCSLQQPCLPAVVSTVPFPILEFSSFWPVPAAHWELLPEHGSPHLLGGVRTIFPNVFG